MVKRKETLRKKNTETRTENLDSEETEENRSRSCLKILKCCRKKTVVEPKATTFDKLGFLNKVEPMDKSPIETLSPTRHDGQTKLTEHRLGSDIKSRNNSTERAKLSDDFSPAENYSLNMIDKATQRQFEHEKH